jgi:hypothetical protein
MPSIGKTGQPALLPNDAYGRKATSDVGKKSDSLARDHPLRIRFCQSSQLPR